MINLPEYNHHRIPVGLADRKPLPDLTTGNVSSDAEKNRDKPLGKSDGVDLKKVVLKKVEEEKNNIVQEAKEQNSETARWQRRLPSIALRSDLFEREKKLLNDLKAGNYPSKGFSNTTGNLVLAASMIDKIISYPVIKINYEGDLPLIVSWARTQCQQSNSQNKIEWQHKKIEMALKKYDIYQTLNNGQDDYLTSDYQHTASRLKLVSEMVERAIQVNNHEDLPLLLKYIESHYYRINLKGIDEKEQKGYSSSGKYAATAIRKVGIFLSKLMCEKKVSHKESLILTQRWAASLTEMMIKSSDSELLMTNVEQIKSLVKSCISLQVKDSEDFDNYLGTCSLICMLHCASSAPGNFHFLQSQFKGIQSLLFELSQHTMALTVRNDKTNPYMLSQLRFIMDIFSRFDFINHYISPREAEENRRERDALISRQLGQFEKLPLKHRMRNEINVLLAKYLDDTNRPHKDYRGRDFKAFITEIREKLIYSHNLKLSSEVVIHSQSSLESEKDKLNLLINSKRKIFKGMFGTNKVKDDNSRPLEIFISTDKENYERYGYYPFRIKTNNGGMYMEGNPADPDNQPRIYLYCNEGKTLNFVHEMIHYLDGKYNVYGNGNAQINSEYLTWWSEGLATYLDKEDDASSIKDLLTSYSPQQLPSLKKIMFVDEFSANGNSDRIYGFPVLVHTFLNSSEELKHERDKFVLALRQPDNGTRFPELVRAFWNDYDQKFSAWIKKQQLGLNNPQPHQQYSASFRQG